jgi:hypothetical protein
LSRLLAFGCSFTNYHWSTWADILAPEFDSFENWAAAGAGNHFIFNSVMEADQQKRFGPGDTVIVCWTNVMREDRYIDSRGWVTLGNITTSNIYTKEFVADLVTERGCLIRDLAMIKAVKVLLEARPGVTWKFISMAPILQADVYDDRKLHFPDVFEKYQDVIESILVSYQEVLGPNYWNHNEHLRPKYSEGQTDYHPTPLEHWKYVQTALSEYSIRQATIDKITAESQSLRKTRPGGPIVPRL